MAGEVGAQIGSKFYYIMEAFFYLAMSYTFIKRPEKFMTRIFKKYNKTIQMFSYFMGVVGIVQLIGSVLNIIA